MNSTIQILAQESSSGAAAVQFVVNALDAESRRVV